jgi:hypothetical protein
VFGDIGMYIGRVDASTRQPAAHPIKAATASAATPPTQPSPMRRTRRSALPEAFPDSDTDVSSPDGAAHSIAGPLS